MGFKEGDLIKLKKSSSMDETYSAVGLILRVYKSKPLIFLNDKKMNDQWLEEEDIQSGTVYDIIYEGIVEEAVLEDWLTHFADNI